MVRGMTHVANAEMGFVRVLVAHFLSCPFAAAALVSVEETKELPLASIGICLLRLGYQLDFARAGVRESLLHSKLVLGSFGIRAGSEVLLSITTSPWCRIVKQALAPGHLGTLLLSSVAHRCASRKLVDADALQGEMTQRQASKALEAGMRARALAGKGRES